MVRRWKIALIVFLALLSTGAFQAVPSHAAILDQSNAATLINGRPASHATHASTTPLLPHHNCPPPGAPPQVSATPGVNRATVTWQAASGKGSQITAYVTTAYLASSPSTAIATDGNTLTATLYGLAGKSSYTFKVYAQSSCGSGPGTKSKPVTPSGPSTTYATTVQGDGPTAYYRLSELSGNTAADSSGHAALGTYGSGGLGLGLPGAVIGDPDTAASWNGNCCGLLSSGPKLAFYNGARSIEGWVKTTDGSFRYLAGYGQGGTDQSFNVGVGPTSMGLTTGSDDRYWTTHPLNDGNWHYVVLTYDGKNATAYLDGQNLGSQQYPNGINTRPGGLTVGGAYNGNGNFFVGTLDEVAIYRKVLAASDIAKRFALAGYSRPGMPTNLHLSAGKNSATVTWSPPASGNLPFTRYVITAYQGKSARNATATNGSSTSVTLYGLAGGTAYTIQIYTSNAYGDGPPATSKPVTPSGSSTTYATTVQGDAPTAYYRLSELSGTTAMDSSGHAANGVYASGAGLGQPGAVIGDPDTAASWNGSCCGLLSSGPKLAFYNTARSIEGWIKTTDSNYHYMTGYGQGGTDQSFSVDVGPTAVGMITGNDDRYWGTHTLNDGNWHYLVLTYDGKNATAYVDGQSLGGQQYPSGINTRPSGFEVGASYGGGSPFNGTLDEIAVYTKVLAASDIAKRFALGGYSRPGMPTNVNVSAGSNSVAVTWSPPASGNLPFTRYVITAYQGKSAKNATATNGSSTSVTLYGLAGGTAYTVQIYASNIFGDGQPATSKPVTPGGSSTTYATTVQGDGPTAYYRLSELSGNTAADSSGHAALGTYSSGAGLGQPGAVIGDPDTAASWNGSCCGLLSSGPKLAYYNTARSIEGWVKTTDNNFRYLAGYGQSGTDQVFSFGVGPNQIGLIAYNDNRYWSTHSLNDGNWHYVVLTYDGKNATAYVDGQNLGSQSYPNGINTRPGGLTIGCGWNGNGSCFNGTLDEVAVYTKVLAASDIAKRFALAGYSRPGVPTNLHLSAGKNSATVTWAPPASGSQPISRYVITAYQGKAAHNATATNGSSTSVTVYGLAGGTAYTIQIYASNQYGDGVVATSSPVTPSGPSTTYATTVQGDAPTAYYRLSELSGTTAMDSSGHAANGVYVSGAGLGQPGAVIGDPDTAASWNGSCCGLLSSGPKLAYYNTARSIEGWVKTTDNNFRYLAGYGQSGTDQVFSFGVGPNQIGLITYNDDRYWSTHSLNDGNWHYVVLTYDGTNATAYVDGQNLGSQSYPNGINTRPGGLTIGCGWNGNGSCFNGTLDEVAVYTKVLAASDIAKRFALAGYSRPGVPTNLHVSAGKNSLTVTWSPPASGNLPISRYVITAYQGKSARNATATNGSSTSVTLYGLAGKTAYTIQIYASNQYGDGAVATSSPVTPSGPSTTYATTVQGDGPIAYYRLSELSGTTAMDSSGHAANGVYSAGAGLGQPGAIIGDPDTAALWNGRCCGLLSSGPQLAFYNAPRTVEAWVKTTDGSFRYLAGYGQGGNDQSFSVGVGPNQIGVITGNDDRYFTTTPAINDGMWHYIVVTYDGTNLTAYLDGKPLPSQSYPSGINTRPGGLTVGGGYNGNGNSFNGTLDEVAVYSRVLSASQVLNHYHKAGY